MMFSKQSTILTRNQISGSQLCVNMEQVPLGLANCYTGWIHAEMADAPFLQLESKKIVFPIGRRTI